MGTPASQLIDVIVIGNRPGCLQAAHRMGLRTLLVADVQPSALARRRIAEWVQVPLDIPVPDMAGRVLDQLRNRTVRAVFAAGERGVYLAAALREALGMPGLDLSGALRVRDKALMKETVRKAGVRCTDWAVLDVDTEAGALTDQLGLPVVLKERDGAGSGGLQILHDEPSVAMALGRLEDPSRWLAERFVSGAEMSIESFLLDGEVLMTNPTEYFAVGFANIAPAGLSDEILAPLLDLNARALAALGPFTGMTHLELYRSASGPVFGEVALRPPGGRIMRLLRRAYDFDPWEAALRLELGERPELPDGAARHAGVWMLHPGEGVVADIRGLTAARRIKGVTKLICRVEPGSVVRPRSSTGVDVGWIEVRGPSRDKVADRLRRAHELVEIRLEG